MTAEERRLLRAVFAWARTAGVCRTTMARWTKPGPIEQRWGVWWDGFEPKLTVWRGRDTGKDYWVRDIAEAVDVLVALGILPPRFSSAYRAGWYAGAPGHLKSLTDAEYAAAVPAGLSS